MKNYNLISIFGISLIAVASLSLWRFLPESVSIVEIDGLPQKLEIPGYSYNTQPPLSGWEDERLKRVPKESDLAFVSRLNQTIFSSIYHCDYSSAPRLIDKVLERSNDSFHEVGILSPGSLRCGYCHQVAYVLARALNNEGLRALPLALNGHVVTLIYLASQAWIADPDSGLGPFKYHSNMWSDVRDDYMKKLGPYTSYEPFRIAFQTSDDDVPYFSMDWLNKVEAQQEEFLNIAKFVSYGIGILGFVLLCFGVFRRRAVTKKGDVARIRR